MFDKLSIKQFAYIFLALLLITIIYFFIPATNKQSSFNKDIIDVDSSKISSIEYYKQSNNLQRIELSKTDDAWIAKQGNLEVIADKKSVENLINQILAIKPLRLVAKDHAQFEKFEVTENMGTRLILKQGKKIVLDLIVGKFSVEQSSNPYSQQPEVYSHIRLANENEVFVVPGFLSMIFTDDINSYRDRTLLNMGDKEITSVEFSHENQGFMANKSDNVWKIDNLMADSLKMQQWIDEISYLSSSNFVNQSDISLVKASWTLTLGTSDNQIYELQGFKADSVLNYYVKSSVNKQNLFSDKDLSILKSVLIDRDSLLAESK